MAVYKTLFANLAKDKFYLIRRVIIAFAFVFSVVLAIISLSWISFNRMKENQDMVEHTHQTLHDFEVLLSTLKDAETGQRGFLITNDTVFLEPYNKANDSIRVHFNRLQTLLIGDPQQMQLLDSLHQLISLRFSILKKLIDKKNNSSLTESDYPLLYEGKSLMDQIRKGVERGEQHEQQLLQQRNEEADFSTSQSRITIIIFTFLVLTILFISLIMILSGLKKRAALEELLKSVLDASNSGILSFQSIRDEQGKIIDFRFIQANLTSYSLTSSEPASFNGKTLLQIFPETRFGILFDEYVKLVETGIPFSKDFHSQRPPKSTWFHLEAVKLADGFTLTFNDISKEKQNEIELQNYLTALQHSNRELEEFAYVASHDLQEPLRKIVSFIERLRMKSYDALNEDSRTYLDRIRNSASRMRVLINDLLTYSRAGKTETELQSVDLNAIIAQILIDLEVNIEQKKAIISVSQLPVIESTVVQMQQLFLNLLSNAIKFTDPARTPRISIQSDYRQSQDGEIIPPEKINSNSWCRITVKDNGIGFDNQYSKKIFEVFQRLHGRSEYEGTGIGLAICKKIVSAHHGTIVAEGTEGEGAEFIISLPLH